MGAYLSLRGYRSFEGDQAYRLPLLLRRQDPTLYTTDPFVRSFDHFNPHAFYLSLLEVATLPLGLSAALFLLLALAFALTAAGLLLFGRSLGGPDSERAAVLSLALFLIARAGNLGTNHLFEPILLDRLLVFGLGWLALGRLVLDPNRPGPLPFLCLGLGALLHPSLGFLLAGLAWCGALFWRFAGNLDRPGAWRCLVGIALACLPGLLAHGGRSAFLFVGLPEPEFRLLSFNVQGPQHMLPHLWRAWQWAAGFAYLALAFLGLGSEPERNSAWHRMACLLTLCLAILAVSWVGIESVQHLKLTILQPFRLATVARGLCLVLGARHLLRLWRAGGLARVRAAVLVAGLTGDMAMVFAITSELACVTLARTGRATQLLGTGLALGLGLFHMARHDTESGHLPILLALGLGSFASLIHRSPIWSTGRFTRLAALSWALPVAGMAAGLGADPVAADSPRAWLLNRYRFGETPIGDVERLASWCRQNTPQTASFIGPPGPKEFRLWSRRSVAFNRAASPYHAEGLKDWSARFRAHVAFDGTTAEFARDYQADRHALEARYNAFTPEALALLAAGQGADHVLTKAPAGPISGPLELLRVEGRYAVYRVDPEFLRRSAQVGRDRVIFGELDDLGADPGRQRLILR